MKTLVSFSIGLLGLAPAVFGQGSTQVNYSAPLGHRTVYLNATTPVANGNTVWIGGFNSSFQNQVQANRDNPAALLANWHEYDATTITSQVGPFTQPGSFSQTGTSDVAVFDNLRMYLWIFSTTDGQAPAPGFANVTAYGLFTSTTDPDWVFPALNTPFPGYIKDIYTGDAVTATRGSIDGTHLYLGTFSLVPEPSTVGLLSVGLPAAVLMLRRRRKG